jgi:hypothetical protein
MSDNVLLIFFGSLTAIGLLAGVLGVALAVRSARKQDNELKMAFVALAGLSFSGMCTAYFLLPILVNHLSR